MGGCLSRKNGSSDSSLNIAAASVSLAAKEPIPGPEKGETEVKIEKKVVQEEKVKKEAPVVEEEGLVKKEIFVIKHRKSHDKERPLIPSQNDVSILEEKRVSSNTPASSTNTNPSACSVELGNNVSSSMVVRTSSCTKEEVDAILIQCGRLSRSNSSGKVASSGRKYSGSKRSYDLDQEQDMEVANATANYDYKKRGNDSYCNDDEDDQVGGAVAERRQHRQRHRRPSPSSSSQGRRRTPSTSREREQRSGSRERGNGSSSSGRRVSRSPNRRSETNPATANSNGTNNVNNNSTGTNNRPGKMVSVPATVSSLTMDKSNNNGIEPQTATTSIKRISVKRNVGEAAVAGSRGTASPRSQSPARANGRGSNDNNSNQQQQQQPSLSRSSSRKQEQSPYRRNPLSEIDTNSLVYAQATGNNKNASMNNNSNSSSRVQIKNKEIEGQVVVKESIGVLNQVQKPNAETNRLVAQGTSCKVSSNFVKEPPVNVEDAKLQPSVIGADLKPQTLTRSRSARRSRDLDFNPETLLNPAAPSYTALLLEDIQNFHQKNTNTTTTTTPPSFSIPPCVTKACSILEAVADLNSTTSSNLSCPTTTGIGANLIGKKRAEAKDPFVESEVLVSDDLMEPSFHKYVTVRRGGTSCAVEDMDGQESSGSNSFVGSGSQQHWGYSNSSWEPNSADSTDRWTSRSNTREEDDMEEARRGFSGQRSGIGRGRGVGSGKNLHSTPIVAATAST